MEPLISVIIPVYLVQDYLDTCIKSIVNQTYKNLEIILVDDGSPDMCPNICDNWGRLDDRIKIIHKTNGGLSDARNVGIDLCNGDYIAFLDGDDFVSPRWIEKMVIAAQSYKSDIVVCGRYLYKEGYSIKQHCLNTYKIYTVEEAIKELLLGREIEEAAWDKLYRRELFSTLRFPVGEINEDIVTIPFAIENSNQICHIGEPLYYYRQTNTGITKSRYSEKKSVYIKHICEINNYFSKKYPQMSFEVGCFVARYSYAMLLGLSLNNNDCKEFSKDYSCYLNFLRKNTKYILKSNTFPIKDILKIIILDFNLFPIFIRLKKRIVR